MTIDWETLVRTAELASGQAYAKYSNFRVGAAVLTADGRVFAGCNVENGSYGLTICAERTAVFTAVAAGATELLAAAVYTPTNQPVTPCGACRQVLAEFADDMPIRMACAGGTTLEYSLGELLPHTFRL